MVLTGTNTPYKQSSGPFDLFDPEVCPVPPPRRCPTGEERCAEGASARFCDVLLDRIDAGNVGAVVRVTDRSREPTTATGVRAREEIMQVGYGVSGGLHV